MYIYMAPLEGITEYSYRLAHAKVYGKMDKYFTPFIVPMGDLKLKSRDKKEIMLENNEGLNVVPQILTNNAELFIGFSKELEQLGYKEINLNLGCPSGTVTAKGRGAGFLSFTAELDAFLQEIFEKCPISISVKTRIGVQDTAEFEAILDIFNKYPMTELIIHPRLLKEKYKGEPHLECFQMAAEKSLNPLVFNGNVFTTNDFKKIEAAFPNIKGIMLGRGLIAEPGLPNRCKGEETSIKELQEFHSLDYESISKKMSGDKNILHHMKEFWFYAIHSFNDYEKYMKKLRKITRASEYELWIKDLFMNGEWNPERGFTPPN